MNKELYLARDSDGFLYLYLEKPHKEDGFWTTNSEHFDFESINEMFDYVKWEDEEPTKFKKEEK